MSSAERCRGRTSGPDWVRRDRDLCPRPGRRSRRLARAWRSGRGGSTGAVRPALRTVGTRKSPLPRPRSASMDAGAGSRRNAEDREDGRREVRWAAPAEDGRNMAPRAPPLAREHVEPRASIEREGRRRRPERSGRSARCPGTRSLASNEASASPMFCGRHPVVEARRESRRRTRVRGDDPRELLVGRAHLGARVKHHERLSVGRAYASIPREQGLERRIEERGRVATQRSPRIERRRSDERRRAYARSGTWQVAQARAPPGDSRRSKNSRRPSAARRGIHRERGTRKRERADVRARHAEGGTSASS